jgi:hypothetical protein
MVRIRRWPALAPNSLPARSRITGLNGLSAPPHPPLYTIIENMMADEAAEQALARDIIAVHGTGAAAIARQNARTAAVAGQPVQAKSWIRVVGSIQRRQTG